MPPSISHYLLTPISPSPAKIIVHLLLMIDARDNTIDTRYRYFIHYKLFKQTHLLIPFVLSDRP